MSRIVVSFLGKANGGMYKATVYRHGAEAWGPSAYFGMELAQRMRPDRLVIFGTAGSMWDVLLSDQLGDAEFTAAHLELMNAAQEGRITENQLSALRPLIERAVGCKALLKLVGFAADTAGQMAILADIAAILAAGDELILDVTHGFRHLPMLTLAAAAFLRHVRGVRIGGLYYGAWEMPGSPVLDLRGLLDLLDWVQALAAFDASGDLGVFAATLRAAGLEAGATAKFVQAAFDERNQNPEEAGQALLALAPSWRTLRSPAFGLFQQQFVDRVAWTRAEERWRREFLLSEQYLMHGD